MKDYSEMPSLDASPLKLSEGVASIMKRVQKQGDPQLIIQLDSILEMESEEEILVKIQDITKNIIWKE